MHRRHTGHTVEPYYLAEFVGVVRRIFLLVQFGVVVDVPAVARTSRMVLGTVLAHCLVRQRIHVLSLLVVFLRYFLREGDSDPEHDCSLSLVLQRCARRRQRQWHVFCWVCWYLRTSSVFFDCPHPGEEVSTLVARRRAHSRCLSFRRVPPEIWTIFR